MWHSAIAHAHSNHKMELFEVLRVNMKPTILFDTTLFNSEITKAIEESRLHAATDASADGGKIARF